MPFFTKHKRVNTEKSLGAVVSKDFSPISRSTFPAMENAPFWSCVTKLCRNFSTLPLHVYVRNGKTVAIDTQSPLAHLLENPCPYLDETDWRWIMHFNFEIHGMAMAIIARTGAGDPYALYPVSPRSMIPVWNGNKLFWKYNQEIISDDNVLIIRNTPISSTSALCPIDYAANDLAVAKSSQELQKNFFDRATTLGGIVTVPRSTSKEAKQQLAEMFRGEFAGAGNSYKTIVLEDNLKYEPIRLSERDTSKMTEAQNYTLTQVAERFGVPPFFLGDLTKATFSNSEQQGMDLVTYALQPRAIAFEKAFKKICRPGQFIKYSLQGLMRGDHAARSAFYHNGIMDGWLSINEVRQLEDLNPIADGDKHFFPMNYTTLDKVGQDIQTPGFESKDHTESKCLTEKHRQEELFVEATHTVSKSARSSVEREIRKQLKKEIEILHNLVGEGATFNNLLDQFKEEVNKTAEEFGLALAPIFDSIMTRLIPIVKKQVGSAADVDERKCQSITSGYARDMAQRHIKERIYAIKQLCAMTTNDTFEDDLDEVTSGWIETVPAEESTEETRRAGNFFDVSLFQELGVTVMHVVAGADSCEFCNGLDGKVVSVQGTVLQKGDEVKDGQGNVRVINKNYRHPPFHIHCECGVAPGR